MSGILKFVLDEHPFTMLSLHYSLFGMCPFWNVLFLECALFGMFSFWSLPCSECAVFGMCSFWNVPFLESFWNVPYLECAVFGMCSFWNVSYLTDVAYLCLCLFLSVCFQAVSNIRFEQ